MQIYVYKLKIIIKNKKTIIRNIDGRLVCWEKSLLEMMQNAQMS